MQQKKLALSVGICLLIISMLSSCTYDKYLPENQTLLWQNRVIYKSKLDKSHKDDVSSQVGAAIIQKNNNVIFGLDLETANIGFRMPRPKLAYYNLLHKSTNLKRDSLYIEKKYIEAPIAFDTLKKNTSLKNIKNTLFNHGYFYATVTDSVVQKENRKTCVYYLVNPGKYYNLVHFEYATNNPHIDSLLKARKPQSAMKIGAPLSHASIAEETGKITEYLTSCGYFNMRPSAITAEMDTVYKGNIVSNTPPFDSLGNEKNSLSLGGAVLFKIADSINKVPLAINTFGNINIYFNDKIRSAELLKEKKFKTHMHNGMKVFYENAFVKLSLFDENIFIKKGGIFNINDVDFTLNKLNNLAIFNTVTIDLVNRIDSITQEQIVDANIYLRPNDRYSYEIALEGSAAISYDFGTGIRASAKDNNVMRSGSTLNLAVETGFQSRFTENKLEIIQNNFGINSTLLLAKPLVPAEWFTANERKNIFNTVKVGYNVFRNTGKISRSDADINFNYNWVRNKRMSLRLSPVMLNLLQVNFLDANYKKNEIDPNPFLSATLRNFIILGSNINFEYTNKTEAFQKNYSLARVGFEKSGSLLGAILTNDSLVAQYFRFDNEFRHYINRKHSKWVNRSIASFAFPKRGTSVPFSKLQSAGGANGMRGWQVNELGPGRTRSDTLSARDAAVVNRGDIKLEFNSEYRYDIVSLFGGVVKVGGNAFLDVGNIWRYRDATNNFAAQFKLNKLYQDLAADIGGGLRYDFSLFLIRTEVAMQIKQPYNTQNNGWAFDQIEYSKSFRQNNMRFQFGINYPF